MNNKSLLMLVSEINPSDVKSPTEEIKNGEVEVGKMSDDIRRLWGLYVKSVEDLLSIRSEISRADSVHTTGHIGFPDRCSCCGTHCVAIEKLDDEIRRLIIFSNHMCNLASIGIYTEFPEIIGKKIGVRKDFTIVSISEEQDAELGTVAGTVEAFRTLIQDFSP